jgi:hypothetical protein
MCVYVCVCVDLYVCVCVDLYVCVCVDLYVCVCVYCVAAVAPAGRRLVPDRRMSIGNKREGGKEDMG